MGTLVAFRIVRDQRIERGGRSHGIVPCIVFVINTSLTLRLNIVPCAKYILSLCKMVHSFELLYRSALLRSVWDTCVSRFIHCEIVKIQSIANLQSFIGCFKGSLGPSLSKV